MGLGKYNKRLLIQQPVKVESSFADAVTTWPDVGTVWALIEPLKGRDAMLANQLLAPQDTKILIRYHAALTAMNATWRCSYNGVVYNIVSVVNVNLANTEFELMCTSGVNDG
jgi:SPP1 family predicted phage head-tail adaptor